MRRPLRIVGGFEVALAGVTAAVGGLATASLSVRVNDLPRITPGVEETDETRSLGDITHARYHSVQSSRSYRSAADWNPSSSCSRERRPSRCAIASGSGFASSVIRAHESCIFA